jgi:hypothetical protein
MQKKGTLSRTIQIQRIQRPEENAQKINRTPQHQLRYSPSQLFVRRNRKQQTQLY